MGDPLTAMAASLTRFSSGSQLCHKCMLTWGVQLQQSRWNCNRASVTRINRIYYAHTYPTLLVKPDGSTINIKYKVPRGIIRLPVDISTLSEEDKAMRLAKRKPKEKIVIKAEIDVSFEEDDYSHLEKMIFLNENTW